MTRAIAPALALAWLVVAPAARAQPPERAPEPERAEAPDNAPSITLTIADGRLSLEARDASLPAILDEVGDRTGLRVRLDDAGEAQLAGETVTMTLEGVPVEDALRRLLRGKDFVLVYSPNRLAEARVYGHSEERAGAPPPAASVPSGPVGDPESRDTVARLRNQALTSPDLAARAQALEGLAANADQRAVRDAVLEILERESNPGLLQRALDIVGADRTIPLEPIVKLAASNPAPEVRIKALTQLVEQMSRDPRARQTIETSAADDPAPAVRDAAKTLLQRAAAP